MAENPKNKESNNIEDLMHINLEMAVNVFLKYKDNLSPAIIVQRLHHNRYYQYKVIHFALFSCQIFYFRSLIFKPMVFLNDNF